MKAAIYARKSTDDNAKGRDNKSITRQVDQAKAYAAKKGWSVDEDHIFIDDGISGTVFPRPALTRLMTHLNEFDAVVMMDGDRLGREQDETHMCRVRIRREARIFYYLRDVEYVANTPMDKLMAHIGDFTAAMEVELASQRARDALFAKAAKGFNVGGIVYGYDNYWAFPDGKEQKAIRGESKPPSAHTIFKINEKQAVVIRNICRIYADGHGVTTIAKTLNGDPRYKNKSKKYFKSKASDSPRKGTGSWAPSSVRKILHNERYIGIITYGKTKKRRESGKKFRDKQDEYLTITNKELQIVPDALWAVVRERSEAAKKTYIRSTNGQLWGRPGSGRESKYLLTGIARCGCCDGNITVIGGKTGSGKNRRNAYYYGCSYHQNRGRTVCDNDHRIRMSVLDNAVLESIEQTVLTPDAVAYTVERALEKVIERQRTDPDRPKRLNAELRKVKRELERFLQLVAEGKAPESVLQQIQQREDRIKRLTEELGEAQLEQPNELDLRRVKKALAERIGFFKDLIYSDVPKARQAIRKLLNGPITCNPVIYDGSRKGYAFEGKTNLGLLVSPGYIEVASPRGVEPLLPP